MRWYVEVSRVGESSVAEEYCVEAKQWQAALQEARKLRGDSGALSKFSIELLDRGYRAVDPSLKLRYLINEAPADAKLSGDSGKVTKIETPSKQRAESLAPTAFSTSIAPVAAAGGAPRPAAAGAPRPNSVSPPRPTSVAAPRSQQLLVPDDPVPPAPPLPGFPVSESLRPQVPVYELVRQRAEEPRAESPITYRELAFAVQPGATRAQIEALLHDRYHATLATIEDRPPGKFVQLAVFDHVFKRKPERPPLATFAWKDWRGSPVLAFPGFGEAPMGPMSQVPPAAPESAPPRNGVSPSTPPPSLSSLPLPSSLAPAAPAAPVASLAPAAPVASVAPVAPVAPPLVAEPAAAVVAAPATAPASLAPDSAPVVPMAPVVFESVPPPPAPVESVPEPVVAAPVVDTAPAQAPAPPVAELAAPVVALEAAPAPVVAAPGFDLNFESTPFNASAAAAERKSSPDRASRPRLGVPARRRAGEDLISELFETMHDLHFMRDVAAGAEFVLATLDEVLPCEGVLIHVFDINTSHFVVVRAKGPNAAGVLLQRMPDQDPMPLSVMRAHRAVSVKDAASDPRFNGARWRAVGVEPVAALCGGVELSGRYLGLIELVNPQGGDPFHQSELNALDYICEQFAEFLSKKPIILAPDVILARS